MSASTESIVEEAALAWLESLGYTILHGPKIAPVSRSPNGTITARWCWRGGCARRCSGSTRKPRWTRWTKPSAGSPGPTRGAWRNVVS